MNGLSCCFLAIVVVLTFSCSSTQMIKSVEKKTVWISSTLTDEGVNAPNGGGAYIFQCLQMTENEKLSYDKEVQGLVITEFAPFCGEIKGFDFQEGYFQKLEIEMVSKAVSAIDNKTDVSQWKLVKALDKKKDPTVGEVEKMLMWIGPEMREVRCKSPLSPQDCMETRHVYQAGQFYRGGAWKPLYEDVFIEDFQEGYVYKVTFTKRYNSQMMQVMDGDNYQIEDFKIVSKEKM